MPDARSKQGCDLLLDSRFTPRKTLKLHCTDTKNILSFLRRNMLPMSCEEILERVVSFELVSEMEKLVSWF